MMKGKSMMNFWTSPVPPPRSRDERLSILLEDASLLHDFAVRHGKAVPKDFHEKFLRVWSALTERLKEGAPVIGPDLRLALDQEFRALYEDLNKAMSPVSAESIRATTVARSRTFFRPTLFTSLIALLLFFCIVVLQGFWVVGKRYWDRTGELDKLRVELVKKQDAAGDELDRIQSRIVNLRCAELLSVNSSGPASERSSKTTKRLGGETAPALDCVLLHELRQGLQRQNLDWNIQQRDIQRVDSLAQPVLQLLEGWYDWTLAVTSKVRGLFFATESRPATWAAMRALRVEEIQYEMRERIKQITGKASLDKLDDQPPTTPWAGRPNSSAVEDGEPSMVSSIPMPEATTVQQLLDRHREREKLYEANRVRSNAQRKLDAFDASRSPLLLHSISVTLSVIQGYILPALFGALGAVVFLLRTTGKQLDNWSYVRESAAQWFAHVVVGTMAGVLGGWFMPDTTAVTPSVPALAIPFLLGYGVELFFGLLDRASRALSAEPATASHEK